MTSRASVRETKGTPVQIEVAVSKNAKCERCWHYRDDVNGAGLCGRCETNLHGSGEPRRYA
jgi:isoleucyl-tRNA synthetase